MFKADLRLTSVRDTWKLFVPDEEGRQQSHVN